jgi:hypothetical protein
MRKNNRAFLSFEIALFTAVFIITVCFALRLKDEAVVRATLSSHLTRQLLKDHQRQSGTFECQNALASEPIFQGFRIFWSFDFEMGRGKLGIPCPTPELDRSRRETRKTQQSQ